MIPIRSRLARAAARLVWSSALPLGAGVVHAQSVAPPTDADTTRSPPVVVRVDSQVTATDNGGLAARGQQRSDLFGSLRPELRVSRRSAALELELAAAATLLGYAKGTGQGGVLPDLRASLKSMPVERWVHLDAEALVRQSEVDAFGTRADQGSGVNRRTEGSYRVSPYIEREFLRDTGVLLRHDLGLTTNTAGDATRLLTNETLLRVERKPVPLGAALELTHLNSEASGATSSRFTLTTGRVRGSLAVTENTVLGLIAGQDRSDFQRGAETDTLYGASIQWHPGPRTDLSIELEHRSFGQTGAFQFRHRMPAMSFTLSASRQPGVASSSLGVLGQGADVRNFLDAILTTRYPDPAARAGVVDNVVASRGLDARAAQAIDLVANYPQLITNVQATWAWLSARNAASLALYTRTAKQLARDADPLASTIALGADSRQAGAAVQVNRRLTPQLSANLLARWSRIDGLALRDGDTSEEKSLRLSVQQELSPRSGVSAGIQHTRFTTTVAGQQPYDATLAFIGMSHRF